MAESLLNGQEEKNKGFDELSELDEEMDEDSESDEASTGDWTDWFADMYSQLCEAERSITVGSTELTFLQDGTLSGTVWDCALVMARWLGQQERINWGAQRIVELGSGTGVVGISAATLGSPMVVLTDLEHQLPNLHRNVARHPEVKEHLVVREHAWGEPWEAKDLQPPFDIVLACDVVYAAAVAEDASSVHQREGDFLTNHRNLVASIAMLSSPQTLVLIGMERRRDATHFEEPFFKLMQESFEMKLVCHEKLTPSNPHGNFIDVFEARLHSAPANESLAATETEATVHSKR